MIVQELIDQLQALTPEQKQMKVLSDGCDCWGPAGGVKEEESHEWVDEKEDELVLQKVILVVREENME